MDPFRAVGVYINGELLPKSLKRENIERVLPDRGLVEASSDDGNVRVIAGRFGQITGPARTVTQVDMWDITINNVEETYEFDTMPGNTVIVFVRDGGIEVRDRPLGPQDVALLHGEGTKVLIKALVPSKVLLLAGQPFGEPIANQGPFVMNTREEIRQAMHDYQKGNFTS